jgi:hypothetical protein
VFHLPLHGHLVALALEGSRFAEGCDLTNHQQCEVALTAMVQHSLLSVIDDSHDEGTRGLLSGIRQELDLK